MVRESVYSKEHIQKISTPLNLAPYLQIIQILNKSLKPITLIYLYMPTHKDNLHLIDDIQTHIQATTKKFDTNTILLNGDFIIDILLRGIIQHGNTFSTTTEDTNWHTFIDQSA